MTAMCNEPSRRYMEAIAQSLRARIYISENRLFLEINRDSKLGRLARGEGR